MTPEELDKPEALQNMPAGQGVHAVVDAPPAEKDPAPQSPDGSPSPVELQCLPAGQGTHSVLEAPIAENVPAPQAPDGAGSPLELQCMPVGHISQDDDPDRDWYRPNPHRMHATAPA